VPFGLGTILRRGTGFAGLWLPQTVVSVEFVRVSPLVPIPHSRNRLAPVPALFCLYESVVVAKDGGFSSPLSELGQSSP